MTELDEYHREISDLLDKLENTIKGLEKKPYQQRQTALKTTCAGMKNKIKMLKESYELEINSSDVHLKYKDSITEINKRFNNLSEQLKQAAMDPSDSLFDGRSTQAAPENSSKAMIQQGHQIQDKGMEALKNIMNKVEQGNELADQINLELDRQIEQLDRMYNTVKDTQSILKRTQHLIRYFARQIYTDKLLMCLICLIFIAIVVIIILSATGKGGNLNVPDIV